MGLIGGRRKRTKQKKAVWPQGAGRCSRKGRRGKGQNPSAPETGNRAQVNPNSPQKREQASDATGKKRGKKDEMRKMTRVAGKTGGGEQHPAGKTDGVKGTPIKEHIEADACGKDASGGHCNSGSFRKQR